MNGIAGDARMRTFVFSGFGRSRFEELLNAIDEWVSFFFFFTSPFHLCIYTSLSNVLSYELYSQMKFLHDG